MIQSPTAALAALALIVVQLPGQAGEISGTFRLEAETYCVGEPVLVEFFVTNGSDRDFSFSVGGDYRGTLRHDRFRFRVTDQSGRDFTQTLWGNMGGLGNTIDLKPGETYRTYELLSAWTHLLPPGQYRVRCERKLALDPYGSNKERAKTARSVVVEQELLFAVTTYDRERVAASIRRMAKTREHPVPAAKRFWSRKPVGWALMDLANKLRTGVSWLSNDAAFEKAVLDKLPVQWDDHYFLEYNLRANRNWLTAQKPEELKLTFSVRNNSNKALPHGLAQSSLAVDEVNIKEWLRFLQKMMQSAAVGQTVKPGEVVEVSGMFNKFLSDDGEQELTWRIRTYEKSAKVRLRR